LNIDSHSIPVECFDALAAGGGGPDAIRELVRARYSKNLLMLAGLLEEAEHTDTRQGRLARRGFALLAEVQRQHPAVAERMILHPSVGAWALRATRAYRGDQPLSGVNPGWLSAVAAAAAIRARMSAEIEVEPVGGVIMLPSLGSARLDGHIAVVRNKAGRAEIASADQRVAVPLDPRRDAPGWLGLRQVRAGPLDVIIDDLDSYRMPSSGDLAPRLSAADRNRFTVAIQQAWPLLEAVHPDAAAEFARAVTVIVPLTGVAGGHISSSSSATFGAIALSEPPDPYTCAVTFTHEMQHLKLSALLDVVPLAIPDDGRLYYAPWRDDPRPLSGLLQGAYAFLGVSGFWRRQRQVAHGGVRVRADTEFARWSQGTARAVQTLHASGQLTPAGLDFIDGMAKTLDTWRDERVLPEAEAIAREQAARHLADWQAGNGPIPM
jgi:HEXXH motif-containing protein